MAVVRPGCQRGDFVVQMSHASLGDPQGLDDPLGSLRGEETSGHTEDKTGLGGMAHLTQQDERLLLNDAGTEARSPSPLTKKLPSAFTSASHATPESPQPSGPDHAPSDLSRLVLGLARRWNGPACQGIPVSWRHGPGPPRKLTLNQVTGPHIRDIYMLSSYVCRAETGDPAAANQLARRTDSLLRGDACSNLDRGLRDFRINRLHSRCDPRSPCTGNLRRRFATCGLRPASPARRRGCGFRPRARMAPWAEGRQHCTTRRTCAGTDPRHVWKKQGFT